MEEEQSKKLASMHTMLCLVVNKEGELLLLKRVPDKKLYPNKWAFVGAAPLDGSEDMEAIAHREMVDEIGMDGLLVNKLEPITGLGENKDWTVHAFLAEVDSSDVKLNPEHTEYKWIKREHLTDYDLVPGLDDLAEKLSEKTNPTPEI